MSVIMGFMHVRVGSRNPIKGAAVKAVFERAFSMPVTIQLAEVDSGVRSQPIGDEVARGALTRARSALHDADYGVGIEAGLIFHATLETYFDVQFCAVVDRAGWMTVGHGPGFVHPPSVIAQVQRGRSIGDVMSTITGIEKIGRQMGAIGYLSQGLLDRQRLTEQAVLVALLPRLRQELYRSGM